MIEAIRILGEYEKNNVSDLELYLSSTSDLKNIQKVICIVFEDNGNNFTYSHTHVEDFDFQNAVKYLYKDRKDKNFDVTPTSKIKKIESGKGKNKNLDIDKVKEKVKKRLEKWFKAYENKDDKIKSLKEEFEKNKDKILKDFSEKYMKLRVDKDNKGRKIDEQANSIITFKIKEGSSEKYLSQIQYFVDLVKEETQEGYHKRKSFDGEAKGNGSCYVCGKNSEVYGLAFPFSFYTFDKRGFAPEFRQSNAWKSLPVCKKCADTLRIGYQFLNKYLFKDFYEGYKFFIIPYFYSEKIDKNIFEEIKRGKGDETYEGILIEDDYFLKPILEKGDLLSLIFMFVEQKQGSNYYIAKYVEDIPPSWIKKMNIALNEVLNEPFCKEEAIKKIGILGGNKSGDFKKIFKKRETRIGGLIETFFPNSKETGIYQKYFIDIIGDILLQRQINREFLINAFIREICSAHVKNDEYKEKVLAVKSFILLLFLDKLNLIKGENMERNIDLEGGEKADVFNVENFLKHYSNAFNSADKQASFLIGVLTEFLLDIQFKKRNSKPFWSKLHGLKLDKDRLKKLYPEILQKLREYEVSYSWLEEMIGKKLTQAEDEGWNISNDEVSYYFALGLNLGRLFKGKNVETQGGGENE
ncbi:MAG: TIGR02556 family CRISPR-associated protein [Thermoplasmata archaeon]